MTRVVSRQNSRYREIARLVSSSRERRKTGRCVLEGEHLVAAYLDRVGVPDTVVASEDALARPGVAALLARVSPANAVVVPQALFDDMGTLMPDVGVIAVAAAPRIASRAGGGLVLLVEAIQDPGNLGSMLRSAAAFGATDAWLSKECAFAWSPKVLRAGQGAHFLTTVVEDVDLAAWVASFRARGGLVAAMVAHHGADLYATALPRPLAIAVGNEGSGLSAPLAASADTRITIPMPGGMESLNAAAAAAVVLFETVRRGPN